MTNNNFVFLHFLIWILNNIPMTSTLNLETYTALLACQFLFYAFNIYKLIQHITIL